MTSAELLLELDGGLLLFSGAGAGHQYSLIYALRVTYLVKQVVAAFWKSAEVQTQVVSVLIISITTLFLVFGSSTHMELQPAEAAAWVTHWRTQAEIPLDSQRVRGSSARKNLRLGIDCGQGGSDCDDGCDSEFHCGGCDG